MKPKLAGTALMIGGIAAFALLYARVLSESRDWPVYGGGLESIRYSALKQINRTNVHRLEISWTYDAGDGPGGLETSPIIVNGILYANTPKHKVFALVAASGKLRWTFDSGIEGRGPNRGVTYWCWWRSASVPLQRARQRQPRTDDSGQWRTGQRNRFR
jgi:glucose dehydrogenase